MPQEGWCRCQQSLGKGHISRVRVPGPGHLNTDPDAFGKQVSPGQPWDLARDAKLLAEDTRT